MIIEAPKIKKGFLEQVEQIVGAKAFSIKDLDRLNYSRDSNFKSVIQIKYNRVLYFPDLIVWPSNTEQIQKLIRLAISAKMPLVPFGAGSGVCGGVVPVKGGMIIDMKRMRKILKIDEDNLLVEAQTGIMGLHLEEELQRKGYTLGHFPSSILCAGLGGYLAARSAGQTSSRYGKIEDMVVDLEMVSGKGEIIQTRNVANSDGLDLNQIILGSEGTLGIISQTTLRIHPLAPFKAFRGIRFRNMDTGIEAMRRIMQTGLKPSVLRLYDELDTFLFLSATKKGKTKLPSVFSSLGHTLKYAGLKTILSMPGTAQSLFKFLPGCLLVMMHEGHERLVSEEQNIVMEICRELGGQDLGEEPGRHWHDHRYRISYEASILFYEGAFTDTIEVATTWDKINDLYEEIIKAVSPHALVMAHLSHVYPDGGSLYFTFVASLKGPKKSEHLYDFIWDEAMKTCQKVGGVISHHHGIGKLKAKYMDEEWGSGKELFRQIKKFYDPENLMNPGKLFLWGRKKEEASFK